MVREAGHRRDLHRDVGQAGGHGRGRVTHGEVGGEDDELGDGLPHLDRELVGEREEVRLTSALGHSNKYSLNLFG